MAEGEKMEILLFLDFEREVAYTALLVTKLKCRDFCMALGRKMIQLARSVTT
jgi:hypothetical protein